MSDLTPVLPTDWGALCTLVFLLGLRHGLDADHLAAIDGLTRVSSRHRQRHARLCGAFFSLGHGSVVMAIALLAGLVGALWAPPAWFEALGSAISIGCLALLGLVNLRAVLRAPLDAPVALVGLRGRWVARLLGGTQRRGGALASTGTGALFALSFDTLSQSALFAVMAVQFGGVAHALTLGALFVLGMVVSDGANGWWMAHLIDRTDRLAVVASRTLTLVVACVSLLVAALGAARWGSAWVAEGMAGGELAVGLAVIALVGAGYLLACRQAHRAAVPEA